MESLPVVNGVIAASTRSVRIKPSASTRDYPGRRREIKQQIVEMTLNSSGVRDISRVLHVSTATVIKELKKAPQLQSVNQKLLSQLQPEQMEVVVERVETDEELGVEESEFDKMCSYVGKKTNPRWLWYAIDRRTGQVLAYVLGARKYEVFLQLKALLEPFGIKRYCTDGELMNGIFQLSFMR